MYLKSLGQSSRGAPIDTPVNYDFRSASSWEYPRADLFDATDCATPTRVSHSHLVAAVVHARSTMSKKNAWLKKATPVTPMTPASVVAATESDDKDLCKKEPSSNKRGVVDTEGDNGGRTLHGTGVLDDPPHAAAAAAAARARADSVSVMLQVQAQQLVQDPVVLYLVARTEATVKRELEARGPLLCVFSLSPDFEEFWNRLVQNPAVAPPVFTPQSPESTAAPGYDDTERPRDHAASSRARRSSSSRTVVITGCVLGWTATTWILGSSLGATSTRASNWGRNGCFQIPLHATWWLSPHDGEDHALVGFTTSAAFQHSFLQSTVVPVLSARALLKRDTPGERAGAPDLTRDSCVRVHLLRFEPFQLPDTIVKFLDRKQKRYTEGDGKGCEAPRKSKSKGARSRATTLTLGHRTHGGGGVTAGASASSLKNRIAFFFVDRVRLYTQAPPGDLLVLVLMSLIIVIVCSLSCTRRGRRFLFA